MSGYKMCLRWPKRRYVCERLHTFGPLNLTTLRRNPPQMECVLHLTMFFIVKVRFPGQSVTLTMISIAKRGRMASLNGEKGF
ncbi:hypothetical protein [Paenibacillus eucommiae]|uniref:Uncharacterized protein n=1 Tax=Paenibacillus eucommiae TaxID=1355755 RepID=A0ABS4J1H2_9BACL|nr:hypothetical protein [Paenibacillus eucommiae]MBP1993645.1 hypothetical protein [Paenibacillus eucommiae]